MPQKSSGNETYQQVMALLPQLSPDEQESLKRWLLQNPSVTMQDLIVVKAKQGVCCPECGQANTVIKYGHNSKGVQRYRCTQCNVTFTSMTYTFSANTKKDISTWLQYVQCMIDGLSLQKAADRCGICIRTAFFWRHKLLDAIRHKLIKIEIEICG